MAENQAKFNAGDKVLNVHNSFGGHGTIEKVAGNLAYIRYDKNSLNAHWVPVEALKSVQTASQELRRVNPDGTPFIEPTTITEQPNPEPRSYYYSDQFGNPIDYKFIT